MRRQGADVETIYEALLIVNRRQCRPLLAEAEVRRIAESVGRYAVNLILDPNDPLPSAREFLNQYWLTDETRALQHQGGVFYGFSDDVKSYIEIEAATVRAQLYQFLETAKTQEKKEQTGVFQADQVTGRKRFGCIASRMQSADNVFPAMLASSGEG